MSGNQVSGDGLLEAHVQEIAAALQQIHGKLDLALEGDRNYKEAAAQRAVRISELLMENLQLRRQLETSNGSLQPSASASSKEGVTRESALASFRRAESRIVMLERKLAQAERERDAARNAHARLRQRRGVRIALGLAQPLIALRRMAGRRRGTQ